MRIESAQWRIAGADATNWAVLLARNNQTVYFIIFVFVLPIVAFIIKLIISAQELKAYHDLRNTSREVHNKTVGFWKCNCGRDVSKKTCLCDKCGSWKCECGTVNQSSDFYCSKCGNWMCTCGLFNTRVPGTCACGKKKRDVEVDKRKVPVRIKETCGEK